MPYRIMYSSQASAPLGVAGLQQILDDARAGNEAHDVTGVLVYVDGVFFQVLEGDREVVRRLMASIARDTRHHSVKVFHEAEAGERAFASWRMAFLSATAEQMSVWAGLPGTTTVEELLADLGRDPRRAPGMLRSILQTLAP